MVECEKKQGEHRSNVLIVTGGSLDVDFAAEYLKGRSFERIIAADAGLSACHRLHLLPTDILGDFDSLHQKELLSFYEKQGVPVRTFPTRKDYTDTHLAVEYAIERNAAAVTLLGATGTRLDHTLANISVLIRLEKAGICAKIVDSHNEMEMLCGQQERRYPKGDGRKYFSLLAWGGEVSGIDLEGFSYPLRNASLTPDVSIGISNEIEADEGVVRIREGNLLVIRASD